MRAKKWLAVATAVGCVSTGVAVAGSGPAETKAVTGDFHANVVGQPRQRQCDANHVRTRIRYEGEQTSSDRRLRGDLEATVETVQDTQTGYGYLSGSFVILRSRGHHRDVKFRGKVEGVVEPDGGAEGFLTGRTVGRRKSAHLFANFNANQDVYTGAITGEFGKDSQVDDPYVPNEDQDPAVLSNGCFRDGHH